MPRNSPQFPAPNTRTCLVPGCGSRLRLAGNKFSRARGQYRDLKCKKQAHAHWQGADGAVRLAAAGRGSGRTPLSAKRPWPWPPPGWG